VGGEREASLREKAASVASEAGQHFHEFEIARAIETIWTLCSHANRYIQESQPWTMKGDQKRAEREACLYHMCEAVRQLGHMVSPVMPEKGRQIISQMGLEPPPMDAEPPWPAAWGEMPPGITVPKPVQIFPRIDKKAIPSIRARLGVDEAMTESENERKNIEKPREIPADGLIDIDHFGTVKLKVCKVLSAERVEKTDKLMKLSIDVGEEEPRTLVAGIALAYTAEDLVGKQLIVVSNLRPAKLRGIESRGMVLMARGPDGLHALTVDAEVPPGSEIS
jgi:methionyl-tRNA synthetase